MKPQSQPSMVWRARTLGSAERDARLLTAPELALRWLQLWASNAALSVQLTPTTHQVLNSSWSAVCCGAASSECCEGNARWAQQRAMRGCWQPWSWLPGQQWGSGLLLPLPVLSQAPPAGVMASASHSTQQWQSCLLLQLAFAAPGPSQCTKRVCSPTAGLQALLAAYRQMQAALRSRRHAAVPGGAFCVPYGCVAGQCNLSVTAALRQVRNQAVCLAAGKDVHLLSAEVGQQSKRWTV